MKKYLLVLLCFLLAGCQQPIKEEPLQKTTLFDKALSSDIEKIIVSDADSAQIIRNPKQIHNLLQYLNDLSAADEKRTDKENFAVIVYADNSSERFTFNEEQICAQSCAKWDQASFMKLASADAKLIEYTEIPAFLSAVFAEPLKKAVFFQSCEEAVCKADQLKEEALDDFQLYLRMLAFGKKTEKPKEITDYIQLTTLSNSTILLCLSMNEEGRFIGINDEWVSFNFQDAILSKQLSEYGLKTVQAKNPAYRQSTVFAGGVGAQLEINGFIYDEETHEFTREATPKVIINETTIQFIDNENINSYNLLSDTSQFNMDEDVSCTYFLNAQDSEGCTLDEAKANYLDLRTQIDELFNTMDLTMSDVRAFLISEKEKRFTDQLSELYPVVNVDKPMLGNVTDLDSYLMQLGYTKDGFTYTASVTDPIYGDLIISYQAKDLIFKIQRDESYAQLRLASEYGEGVDADDPLQAVCSLDFTSGLAVGDCLNDRYYSELGRHLNARHVLMGWQHQLLLSDEELVQYAEMLSENE